MRLHVSESYFDNCLTARWSLAAVSALLLAVVPSNEAQAAVQSPSVQPSITQEATSPAKRRLFERGVFFSPHYLGRIFTAAQRAATLAMERADRAAAYAEHYGISQELAETIIDTAEAEGIDPELGFRVIRVESVFRTDARGPGGSLGLMQLMPSTARAIDRNLRTEAQILDPVTNLRTGFRYLRALIDRYGDVRLGLLAYNRGEGTVDRALQSGRDPENGYSPKVLELGGAEYTGNGVHEEDAEP